MRNEKIAVHARNLSKRFVRADYYVDALKDVTFDARFGEMTMIVGPSGSGKTTLLSVIAGTLPFDKGELDVLNTELHNLSAEEITAFRAKNVGFIFQQFHLIKNLNCQENVSIPLLLNNVSKKTAIERARVSIEQVGLKGRELERPFVLSGGQQQRIAIARALVHNPSIIICDEPTSALDAETGASMMDMLKKISSDPKRCVIIVTHDSRIFKYADRLVKISDGVITSDEHLNGNQL